MEEKMKRNEPSEMILLNTAKAIDVLDEACSRVNLNGYKVPENLSKLEAMMERLSEEKELRIKEGDFAEASMIHQEQNAVAKKIDNLRKRMDTMQAKRSLVVTEEDIAAVVSKWTKIPVQKLTESENAKLKKLD